MMLIDRAASAYQDFVQVTGWIGNLALHIENEFFGRDGPSAHFRDRYGREGRTIRSSIDTAALGVDGQADPEQPFEVLSSLGCRRLRHRSPL
jgi:hypothetical protein